MREQSWEWRGDFYAPDIPIGVDLHYELWDSEMEGMRGPDESDMWDRCVAVRVGDRTVWALSRPDTLTFAVLHLLMHLLHGDLRLHRAWEIAYFLHRSRHDEEFWRRWQALYSPEVRVSQFTTFALAQLWFGCDASETVTRRIAARRLIPIDLQTLVQANDAAANSAAGSPLQRGRLWHHAKTLLPTCLQAIGFWWKLQGLSGDFVKFLVASALFDFGEFVFFLLYNLYLLDLGYHERFIGQVAAAMTAGTLAGVFPAAAVGSRSGLRWSFLVAIAGTCAATALRALCTGEAALLAASFANGFFMAFWAVTLLPVVAGFTREDKRSLGFALISAMGIGVGALAGFVGGSLPALLTHFSFISQGVVAKRAALLTASAFAALALIPATLTRMPTMPRAAPAEKNPRESQRFLLFFLLCLFVWMLGTNGFNPFFNVYFARQHHFRPEQIGSLFAFGQLAQVLAILVAPYVLNKLGQVTGIVAMQIATAATLIMLAVVPEARVSTVLYVGYVCFQYMAEPCFFSMLMSRVPVAVRGNASALNFAVTSIAGIFAAIGAGTLLSVAGYPATLVTCALLLVSAAFLFLVPFRATFTSERNVSLAPSSSE
jgi:MFS family permease